MGNTPSCGDVATAIPNETLKEAYDGLRQEISQLRAEVVALRDQRAQGPAGPTATTLESKPRSEEGQQAVAPAATARQPRKKAQVMISLCVRTMLPVAQRFQAFLEEHGVSTWICTEMDAGVDFRDAIVDAVDDATVFLPLIDQAWAASGECESEFQYAYRRNLTSSFVPRKPVFLPICFPDLDWNEHKHVRLLLASTNALVYKPDSEGELLASLALSMKRCGIQFGAGSNINDWDTERVCGWLRDILLQPVKDSSITGEELMSMSDKQFRDTLKLSQTHISVIRKQLPDDAGSSKKKAAGKKKAAAKGKKAAAADVAGQEVNGLGTVDAYGGWYKVLARTINDADGNVTESNQFLMRFHEGGISSSGCCWNAGTMHNNYDGVTAVMQGRYNMETGQLVFNMVYSNNTHESYAGTLCPEGIVMAKYTWWGYGRRSAGSFDAAMCKLSAAEEAEALTKFAGMLDAGTDQLHNLGEIGRALDWNAIDATKGQKLQELQQDSSAFVIEPRLPVSSEGFIVRFVRPAKANRDTQEQDWLGICKKGTSNLWNPDGYLRAWSSRADPSKGVMFYADLTPPVGEYDLVYFSADGKALARHAFSVVQF